MDSIENSLFTLVWDGQDAQQEPYLYHASQAVSLIQSYQQSTQDMSDILDMMKYLADQAATGTLSISQAQSSQSMWSSLSREYDKVIEETSSQLSLRLNNEEHVLGMYMDSHHQIEVRIADLRFDTEQWDLMDDSKAIQDAIETQQAKIKDYQVYLTDRMVQLEQQGGVGRLDVAQATRDGVNVNNREMAEALVTQVTNDTLQLGVSVRQAFKVPSSMHVQFTTHADYPPMFWMLN